MSVKTSPLTLDPSANVVEKVWSASMAVLLAAVLNSLWPSQLAVHLGPGKKKSLEPVSKSTAD